MTTSDEFRAEAKAWTEWQSAYPTPDSEAFHAGWVRRAEWQASRPITDEQVEAAAKAALESTRRSHQNHWDATFEYIKDRYRIQARAALEAARGASHA